ncbi:hypothetical protein HGA13_23140 [Nocardia speluncae]|uniref:Uncharacterized protein n=1 Tax=Nocardia speluncae TaxID=419477 RepID=A0A846XMP8_9NOCA|nr:hypothetical protein [Nocardia speluncae]NKY35946.1 hypothetical protein [Nocardia speluncae]
MSSHHQIFIDTDAEESALIESIQTITGSRPRTQQVLDGATLRAFIFDNTVVELEMSHEYEDDLGIPFSKYPIVITVRDLNSNRTREESTARWLLDKVCSITGSHGILVEDLQRMLERR